MLCSSLLVNERPKKQIESGAGWTLGCCELIGKLPMLLNERLHFRPLRPLGVPWKLKRIEFMSVTKKKSQQHFDGLPGSSL